MDEEFKATIASDYKQFRQLICEKPYYEEMLLEKLKIWVSSSDWLEGYKDLIFSISEFITPNVAAFLAYCIERSTESINEVITMEPEDVLFVQKCQFITYPKFAMAKSFYDEPYSIFGISSSENDATGQKYINFIRSDGIKFWVTTNEYDIRFMIQRLNDILERMSKKEKGCKDTNGSEAE